VVKTCIKYVLYTPEPHGQDHWQTPKEMIEKNKFGGDCEDIAALILGTFNRLGYKDVRICLVRTLIPNSGHAMVKIKMVDGKWKFYQTVPVLGDFLIEMFYRPIVEFNSDKIWLYSKS